MHSKKLFGNIALIIASLFWGSTFVAQEIGMYHVRPFTFLASRSLLGCLFLFLLIPIMDRIKKKQSTYEKPGKKQKKKLLIGGLCCGIALTVSSGLQQFGMVDGDAGKAGFITAMYILLVPFWGLFSNRKISPVIWGCVGLGVVGLYFLCMKPGTGFTLQTSDIFLILCAISFSIHIVVVDRFSPYVDSVRLSCLQFFITFVLSSILALVFDKPTLSQISTAILPICYAGIFSSGIAFTLQIVAQKYTEPTIASLLMSLESVFSLLTSIVILQKAPSGRELIGCLIMFAAIIISQLPVPAKCRNQDIAKQKNV